VWHAAHASASTRPRSRFGPEACPGAAAPSAPGDSDRPPPQAAAPVSALIISTLRAFLGSDSRKRDTIVLRLVAVSCLCAPGAAGASPRPAQRRVQNDVGRRADRDVLDHRELERAAATEPDPAAERRLDGG